MKEKVVLAYSGGLDTTAIIPWLKEHFGYDVICCCVDCGQGNELDGLEERAKASGAAKLYIEDIVDEFAEDYIMPCVQAGAVYENKYLLGTSMARPVIAKKLVEIARKEGASAICHGATGKGNDQIRFELAIKALAPDLKIIAPWRMTDVWTMQSRDDEIEYCKKHGIDLPFDHSHSYSRDRNLWHISHEGLELEDPANEPNYDHMLVLGVTPEKAPDQAEYVGRIGVGKVDRGTISVNQDVVIVNHHDPDKMRKVKVSRLYEFDGLNKVEVQSATIGSIVAISGISDLHIGDTLCSPEAPDAIPFQKISEPTISMQFNVNDSPLAGTEGKFVTSRHLRDRLFRELNTDVSLRVEETDSTDSFKVSGRGELHLSVLIENMRREGYEFSVSKAEVLYHYDENGKKLEPMELAYIDVDDEFSGSVIQKLGERKGELRNMHTNSNGSTRLEFSIPARGLIGYRGEFMTDTKGTGVLNTIFNGYEPYKGDIQYRKQGSLIAFESGESITYGLFNAQERGALFIGPGVKVYAGMVIGQTGKAEDIEINVCKTKKLTNTRSSSADEALKLTPPRILSLEQALEFIDTDELLEITPKSLRIRKKILDPTLRKRASFRK